MPRQTLPAAESIGPNLPKQSPADMIADADRLAQQRQALADWDARYGLTGAYDRSAALNACRTLIAEAGMRILILGRALLIVKAHEPAGQFTAALDELGIAPRMAQRCMSAARKLDEKESRKLLANLEASKVLELATLDDDTLDEIAEGGLEGLTVDEIDRMSMRELRQQLRELKKDRAADAEATGELINEKDAKINDLERRYRRWSRMPARERADEIILDGAKAAAEIGSCCHRIELAVHAIRDAYAEAGANIEPDLADRIDGLLRDATERVAAMRETLR